MDALKESARDQTAIRRSAWEKVLPVVVAGALVFLAHAFAIQVFTVSSASMSPTLQPGDSVLVNRLVYRLHLPRRGDIIVFRFPQADGREFVKRVIGLPGDVVEEHGGRIYVNGAAPAPVAALAPATPLAQRVAAGHLYVLGDNPDTSLDSRFWGTVDEREVVGKAVFICWSREEHWWQVRWDRIGRWLR